MTVSPSQLVVRVEGPGKLFRLETSEGQTIITAEPGRTVAGTMARRDTKGEEVALI